RLLGRRPVAVARRHQLGFGLPLLFLGQDRDRARRRHVMDCRKCRRGGWCARRIGRLTTHLSWEIGILGGRTGWKQCSNNHDCGDTQVTCITVTQPKPRTRLDPPPDPHIVPRLGGPWTGYPGNMSKARCAMDPSTSPELQNPGVQPPEPKPTPQPVTLAPGPELSAPTSVDIERFSKNIARMVEEGGKALAAYLKPREEGRIKDERAEEITDMVKTLGHVMEYWLSDPQRTFDLQSRLARSYLDLLASTVKRLAGEATPPVVKPDPRDKRFADPEWSSNQFFDFLKQAYLLSTDWANKLVADAGGLDPRERHKAEFYVRQIANAIAPSNFVLTNPELLRETLMSNAENLVRGMHMLAQDIEAGGGGLRIRQSGSSRFQVGRNLRLPPGKVIYQNELMQLIKYTPTTERVLKTPLLIVPPWINKFYILDLTPDKSFIKWCVDQGLTVFCMSWVNPDQHLAERGFSDYMQQGPLKALDVVEEITGERTPHTIGYCVGGTLLAITVAHLAANHRERVKSMTLFTAQVDFTYAGDLKVFAADEAQIAMVERQMAERGYLEGKKMANAFNLLRSNDLIWPYVINNYLKGREPMPFDLLYWNSDATRMPKANHSFYLR